MSTHFDNKCQLETKKVWVCGIYNWQATTTKEERQKHEYPRHNWCDIDTTNIDNFNNVLAVYKKYQVDCISQRCGKGWHFWGDIVDYPTWLKIWTEIKPFADPKWPPLTLRMSKKRPDEIWERPVYHRHKNDPPKWAKSVMSFLCKALRNENSTNLWQAMHQVGLDKYFQCVVYSVELK